MNILGISAFYHDSAAALIQNGLVVAAAQEERFTRKKHDDAFPANAIAYCLKHAGLSIDELDAVVYYEKPFLKFERLLETYLAFSPRGLASFILAMPVWIGRKLFIKKTIRDALHKIQPYDKQKLKLLFSEHHLSHAASAFYCSGFKDAAVLTLDGVGEWACASVFNGNGNRLTALSELHFPHSPGLFYSAVTYFLGFKVNSGEYKLMGLAPYGNKNGTNYQRFLEIIKSQLLDIKEDGSLVLNMRYYNFATGLTMTHDARWEKLLGFKRRRPQDILEQHHCDLALAAQTVIEEIVIGVAQYAKQQTNSENICLAGGVALNCVANGKLQNKNLFSNIFIQPASGDAGGAMGAALAAYHLYFKQPTAQPAQQHASLGPAFTTDEVLARLKKFNAVGKQYLNTEELCEETARLILTGNVVGWFQGRMEFGPRALGNRSILGDARDAGMQSKINMAIKFREGFRPFAPAVLAEDASNYFEMTSESPFMLLVKPVKTSIRSQLPDNYGLMGIDDKLKFVKSRLSAITHVDFSARVQTVSEANNPRFRKLLEAVKAQCGDGVVINTSMNVRSEPIVCTPEEAYTCMMRSEMDYLVIENCIFERKTQPVWHDKVDWKKQYVPD